jgi:sugar phosphate isomerase/epimerase
MYRNLSPIALGITGRQSEIIELSLSYGFKGIDIDLVDFQQTVKTYGLPHARRLLDSARLKLSAFRLPLVWDESDEVYKAGLPATEELAKLAAEIGVAAAITRIAPANDLRPYHENFEFHRRRLAELAELLGQHRLRLGLEVSASAELRKDRAFQFIHSFDALATMLGMIRTTNIGAVVDLFALHASGGSLDEVRKLGAGKIVSVLMSDAPADKAPADCGEADRLLPGENGAIDATAALTMLAEIGYEGPLTPAASAHSTKGQKRDLIVKTAGERLAQAWAAAGLGASGKLAPAKK